MYPAFFLKQGGIAFLGGSAWHCAGSGPLKNEKSVGVGRSSLSPQQSHSDHAWMTKNRMSLFHQMTVLDEQLSSLH